jgi:tRNA G18 (ribose-2'-O)-methylase SpoU
LAAFASKSHAAEAGRRQQERKGERVRGYFGIGVEGISKAMNLGNLYRSAHAFGASFVFTIAAEYKAREGVKADTSRAHDHLPLYHWDSVAGMSLPQGCKVVAVELIDEAVDLPTFRHPPKAAYVLGREKGPVSRELIARADHVVKIPTRFCINVGMAGAIVMYDRLRCLGGFADRPSRPGGPKSTTAGKPGRHAKWDE